MPLSFPANVIGPNPVVQSGSLFFGDGKGRIDLNRLSGPPYIADPAISFAGRMPSDVAGLSVSCGQFISILPATGGIGTTAHQSFFIRTDTPNFADIFALVSGIFVAPGNKGALATITDYAGIRIQDCPVATLGAALNLGASNVAGRFNLYCSGQANNAVAGKFYMAQDNLTVQTVCGMFAGTGVPNNANGANGDFYFRGDTPGVAGQRVYQKSAGAWVATAV